MAQRLVVQSRLRLPLKFEWLPIVIPAYLVIGAVYTVVYGIKYGFRYVTGRPLDGVRRTNATFTQRGTCAVNTAGTEATAIRPSPWSMLPGWKRGAWRVGVPVGAATGWMAYLADPSTAVTGGAGLSGVVGLRAYVVGRRRWLTRRFRALYIRPMARILAPVVGIPAYVSPDKWMTVTPDLEGLAPRLAKSMSPAEEWTRKKYAQYVEPTLRWTPDHLMRCYWWAGGAMEPLSTPFRRPTEVKPPRVEIRLEDKFVDAELAGKIRAVIKAKLGISELDEHWDQVGDTAVGTWTVRSRPRDPVKLSELVPWFDKLAEHEFIVGFGPGDTPIILSLDDDSPHIACSAGSGAGKSVLAMVIAIQVLRSGGRVTIIDRKGSHKWAKNLAGVRYCRKASEMHDALIELAELADANNNAAFEVADDDETWVPPVRNFVIFEEMNSTVAQLRNYWTSIWVKGEPKSSPAIQAFRDIMNMGRSGYVNLFGVAQMLTANTTGGPESRESFGIRCLARYSANNWKMLAPECAMPKKSKIRGRWQVVVAGDVFEVQVGFSKDLAEIRGYAALSVPVSQDTTTTRVKQGTRIGTSPDGDTDRDTQAVEVQDPFAAPMTLKEALELGIIQSESEDVDKAYEAIRKRIRRAEKDGEKVPPVVAKRGKAYLYRAGDLIEWSEQLASK